MAEKFKNLGSLTTPILVVFLIGLALLVGVFWTKIQTLEKGVATRQPTASPPAVPSALSPEKFSEIVKGAILVAGKEEAKVKMVEFSDFQCSFCARFAQETLPQIEKEYIKTGKLAYYYRHFPLYSLHANAENAALSGECAREQGKFREMHDLIFENQIQLGVSDLKNYAAKIGLKTEQFNSCLESKKYQEKVSQDAKLGSEVGVSGAPAFFLNGRVVNGAQPFSVFQGIIEEELTK